MQPDQASSRRKHGRAVPEGQGFWWVDRLWVLAAGLPTYELAVADIAELDLDCWFGDWAEPTCRAVAAHARRIVEADLQHPVILSASGALFDGAHRVAKAWMTGQATVLAVRFHEDPAPDWIEPTSDDTRR